MWIQDFFSQRGGGGLPSYLDLPEKLFIWPTFLFSSFRKKEIEQRRRRRRKNKKRKRKYQGSDSPLWNCK